MARPGIFKVRLPVPAPAARLAAGLRSAGESLLAAAGRHPPLAWLLAPALRSDREARRAAARERDGRAAADRAAADRAIAALRTELEEARARGLSAVRDLEERNRQLARSNQTMSAALAAVAPVEVSAPSTSSVAAARHPEGGDGDTEAALRRELEHLRRKERELLVKANLLDQRVRELRGYADENAALRSRLVDFDAALARAAALQRRVEELEAREFAVAVGVPAPGVPAAAPVAPGASVGDTLDDTLAAVLDAFAARVVVVADAHGLLMGGAGDRSLQENLAAIAGSILETAERCADFLPLGSPHRAELQYVGGIQLSTRMFTCDGETMALTLLRSGELALDQPIEGAVAAIVQLIAATG